MISWSWILCRGGTFLFSFKVSPLYPHDAPKVKCKTKIYHPNIVLEGNVCLNIFREDWKPVLNINTIIYALYHLFTQPNHEDTLNQEVAAVMRDNPNAFGSNVKRPGQGVMWDLLISQDACKSSKFFNGFKLYGVALNLRTELWKFSIFSGV